MIRGGSFVLNLVMCEQVFNQIGSKLTTLIYDQFSWIPELVEYVLSQKFSYFFLYHCFDFFCLCPLFRLIGAHNDVFLLL